MNQWRTSSKQLQSPRTLPGPGTDASPESVRVGVPLPVFQLATRKRRYVVPYLFKTLSRRRALSPLRRHVQDCGRDRHNAMSRRVKYATRLTLDRQSYLHLQVSLSKSSRPAGLVASDSCFEAIVYVRCFLLYYAKRLSSLRLLQVSRWRKI